VRINRHLIERVTLEKFAERHSLVLEMFERHPSLAGQFGKYFCYFSKIEESVGEGSGLQGISGNGSTEDWAMNDYAQRLSNKKLIYDAHGQDRKEIDSPYLTHGVKR
jgi:hypothetical protein